MNTKHLLACLAIAATLLGPVSADDGHNHDAGPAAAAGPALPRFVAASDLFELVGVVDGRQLTVYLDRFADNAPVKDARVELELGSAKVALKENAAGEFEGTLTSALSPGVIAVVATVAAGTETDLLAGDLHVHDGAHGPAAHSHSWREYAGWGAAAIAAVALLGWGVCRTLASRRVRAGGAA